MGLPFQQLKRLWLLYLFLLFFAFFMFAFSINLYVISMQPTFGQERIQPKPPPKRRSIWPIKNVVAHYVGKGNIFGNMTSDDYNINVFNPIQGEGSEGRPVVIPSRERYRMQRFFRLNSFNILASDRIPLNRTLKDYRTKDIHPIEANMQYLHATIIIAKCTTTVSTKRVRTAASSEPLNENTAATIYNPRKS